ncbi:MAG: hypothetical protein Q9190_000138 [Brigantiaea leucoxantha]
MAFDRSRTWPTRKRTHRGEIQNEDFLLDAIEQQNSIQTPLASESNRRDVSQQLHKFPESLASNTFYLLFKDIKGYSAFEEKKILILKDLRLACFRSLLHVVPISASITLTVLNWKGFYIGGELQGPVGKDDLIFLGLQLAAKMIELLVVASLSTIMLALVRGQLMSESLPSGAVTAGSPQFPKIDQEANWYPLIDYKGSMIGSRQWFDQSTRNGSSPGLSWVDLAEDDFGQTSVGAVVALPAGQEVDSINQVLCCTIDARWAHANATVSFLGGPDMVSGSPKNWFLGGRLQKGSNGQPLWSHIRISPSWGEAIKFEMRSAALGYGYGIATANLLSMIVLCVYSLISIIHVFTSVCCTKTTSSAWESITEIIALAVSSSPSPSLRNTGAEIDTLGVFKQPVKIGVSDECLQMVFNDEKAVDKVSQNEYYG